MSKQVWICETCLKPWAEEKAASECEANHPDRSKLSIKLAVFDAYDFQTMHLRFWPARITVLNRGVPEHDRDTATYELKRVGPTPV